MKKSGAAVATNNYLHHFKDLLEGQKIPCQLTPKAIDDKIDTLFVPFEGTNIGLTLTYITPEMMGSVNPALRISMLQYHVALPIDIDKTRAASIAEFVNRLNLVAPIPGWILDRANNAVHYRYVQVGGEEHPSDDLATYMIQVIAFYMTRYVPILVDLCTGKEKFEEAVKKLRESEAE